MPVIARSLVDRLLHDDPTGLRLIHQVPVLTDIWVAFAADPGSRQAMLLSPSESVPPSRAARLLAEAMLALKRDPDAHEPAFISPLQGLVSATLSFRELISLLGPLIGLHIRKMSLATAARIMRNIAPLAERRRRMGQDEAPELHERLTALVLLIAAATDAKGPIASFAQAADFLESRARKALWVKPTGPVDKSRLAFRRATLNRALQSHGSTSIRTVKADAARRVFQTTAPNLVWAVVDSGIDANHPAFLNPATPDDTTNHRIWRAYAFSRLTKMTSYDVLLQPRSTHYAALLEAMRTWLREAPPIPDDGATASLVLTAEGVLEQLKTDIQNERAFSWATLEPLLRISPRTVPSDPHGTHVAGVLAGWWPQEDMEGVCPDLKLLDIRVLGDNAEESEHNVIGALEFIRWLNARNRYRVVHGVNLSVGLKHDVRTWACGQTPVCVACDDLVGSGVVVVAAAGNDGWQSFLLAEQGQYDGYASASITDPGNTESVITVGSTHRDRPHAYGVSFFSSRGPTGDGRAKPDLVAPGEKIDGPLPGDAFGPMDGTSMAAPHVSGVAALLMARHNELQGQPLEIKRILMQTATDLGREKTFQGAGLVDALRALQAR